MKIYEVQQQASNSYWNTLAFISSKEDAEKYRLLYNTKVMIHPTKIVEHNVLSLKDFKDELNEC